MLPLQADRDSLEGLVSAQSLGNSREVAMQQQRLLAFDQAHRLLAGMVRVLKVSMLN